MSKNDLEGALWLRLHLHNLEVGCIRDQRFHPTRKWRADFQWQNQLLIVEVEGGTFSGGRHTTGVGFQEDCVKYAEAMLLGWRVLRVTGTMIESGMATYYIACLLGKREASGTPLTPHRSKRRPSATKK